MGRGGWQAFYVGPAWVAMPKQFAASPKETQSMDQTRHRARKFADPGIASDDLRLTLELHSSYETGGCLDWSERVEAHPAATGSLPA